MTIDSAQPQPAATRRIELAPLLVWAALQLAVLAGMSAGIPLADNPPRPPTRITLDALLVAQTGASALLLSWLMRDWPTSLSAISLTWPFIQAAGFVSAVPQQKILLAMAYVSGWLLLLAVCRALSRSQRSVSALTALASGFSMGGAVLWYLQAEFTYRSPLIDWAVHATWGSIMAAISIVRCERALAAPWCILVGLIGMAIVARLMLRMTRRRGMAAPPE